MGIHFFLSFLCNKLLGKCLIKKCQLSDSNAGHRWYKKQQRHHTAAQLKKHLYGAILQNFELELPKETLILENLSRVLALMIRLPHKRGKHWTVGERERERVHERERDTLALHSKSWKRKEGKLSTFQLCFWYWISPPPPPPTPSLSLSLSLCIFCTSLRNYTHTIFPYLYHCVSTFFPILQLRFWQWNKR